MQFGGAAAEHGGAVDVGARELAHHLGRRLPREIEEVARRVRRQRQRALLGLLEKPPDLRQRVRPAVRLAGQELLRHGQVRDRLSGGLVFEPAGDQRRTSERGVRRQVLADLDIRVGAVLDAAEQLHDQSMAEHQRGVALLGGEPPQRQRSGAAQILGTPRSGADARPALGRDGGVRVEGLEQRLSRTDRRRRCRR